MHYLIFNQIFIPETEQLQLTHDHSGNILLRIGSNSTNEDISEMLSIINMFQKKGKLYKKNKTRFKRKCATDIKAHKNNLTSYEVLDELGITDDKKTVKKNLSMSRQRKRRFKKLIDSYT